MEPSLRRGVLKMLAAVNFIAGELELCQPCLLFATASVVEAAVEGGEIHHLGELVDGTDLEIRLH
jgi:hypothetical protein